MGKKYKGIAGKEKAPVMKSSAPVQATYQASENDTKQEQIDGKLDNLNQYLGKLHVQAKDIGDEITYQNNLLEALDNDMDRVNDKMADQNEDLNIILRK